MRKMYSVIFVGICAFLIVCGFALVASSVPERNQESEQRIASMEVNQSTGNMTGEDYIIALIYAYLNDEVESYNTQKEGDSFEQLQEEASSKYGEYRNIYYGSQFANELVQMSSASAECDGGGYDCSTRHPVIPRQGFIDLLVYEVFHNDSELQEVYPHTSSAGISEEINEARSAYDARIKEEAEREAARKEKEADRLQKQEENAARQRSLDIHYKGVFENYSTEIDFLLNESNFNEALNLTNESVELLVSPYRNIMMIKRGDIYSRIGEIGDNHSNALMYINAINDYHKAAHDFTYCNETAEYKESVNQSFLENKWDRISEMKAGIALQNFNAEIRAIGTNLKNAPNIKQLLSNRVHGIKYSTEVINYTDPIFKEAGYSGYWVQVNISSYNDLNKNDDSEYLDSNIPNFIDIFAALFSNEKISNVIIQLNESYYDKFGHTLERPFIQARLDNKTADQIGDWSAFKKYVGTDRSKFEQVVDIREE